MLKQVMGKTGLVLCAHFFFDYEETCGTVDCNWNYDKFIYEIPINLLQPLKSLKINTNISAATNQNKTINLSVLIEAFDWDTFCGSAYLICTLMKG